MFKSILHRDMRATTSNRLVGLGTLAVYAARRNLLDQLVCMIRDCFLSTDAETTHYGYPVDEHGQPTQLCFERRDSTTQKDKAMIKVVVPWGHNNQNRSFLKESLSFFEKQEEDAAEKLATAGYNASILYYEDLVAFEEGGAENLKTSIKEWTSLLQSWGVEANQGILRHYFKENGQSWKPESHHDTIHNVDEVKAELEALGKIHFFRAT